MGPAGYGYANSGTSFSTPIVTGLVGLIKSYHPTWTKDQIVKQLLYSTENIDLINPGFENLLGTGKINAYHALADSNLSITQELKINMMLLTNTLKRDTKYLYPNTVMSFSLRVQNYSHLVDANPLTISLTSNNPDVLIIDGEYTGVIAANSVEELIDEFEIQIAPNAITAIDTLTFNASANLPVVAGSVFKIYLIVNPSGALVWEGEENGQDYSGEYIKNYLTTHSYQHLYTTESILSFNDLDALFLSFGNFGSNGSTRTVFNDYQAAQIQEYLESGGKVYLEGGDALGYDQVGNSILLSLFGLASANDGGTNIINSLAGQNAAITEGMLFTSSTQVNNNYIDKYFPNSSGTVAFYESGYGNVAVQSIGTYGQRTFCFSYALSELADENPPSIRDTLLQRILDFFQLEPLQLPFAPILISPADSSTVDSNSVFLVWQQSQPAVTRYWLEWDTTDQFSTATIDSAITDTTYLFADLQTNKYYWWRIKAFNAAGWSEFSDVWSFSVVITSLEDDNQLPIEYSLMQNYPNPFNPITTIKYSVPQTSKVVIKVFDILGNEIETLVNEEKPLGTYKLNWNAANLPSGVYFYQIKAGSFVETKKMVLMK